CTVLQHCIGIVRRTPYTATHHNNRIRRRHLLRQLHGITFLQPHRESATNSWHRPKPEPCKCNAKHPHNSFPLLAKSNHKPSSGYHHSNKKGIEEIAY
ncbi:MAG: hypothetical protein IKS36_02090, partial [Bacteroidales bacterium]|nr:hypothetical protein [Bacteroidales bacterium]